MAKNPTRRAGAAKSSLSPAAEKSLVQLTDDLHATQLSVLRTAVDAFRTIVGKAEDSARNVVREIGKSLAQGVPDKAVRACLHDTGLIPTRVSEFMLLASQPEAAKELYLGGVHSKRLALDQARATKAEHVEQDIANLTESLLGDDESETQANAEAQANAMLENGPHQPTGTEPPTNVQLKQAGTLLAAEIVREQGKKKLEKLKSAKKGKGRPAKSKLDKVRDSMQKAIVLAVKLKVMSPGETQTVSAFGFQIIMEKLKTK